MKNTKWFTGLGRITALVTFVIATIICGLFCFTGNLDYVFYGYFFFLFAVPVNIIILIYLLLKRAKPGQTKKENQGIGLMFLNIPVAIIYFCIGIYLMGVMRIKFENNTGKDIKNVRIMGCENETLKILKSGEAETVWIDIEGDCSIYISYLDATGTTQNETVISYVTSSMGQKYTYNIGQGESGW